MSLDKQDEAPDYYEDDSAKEETPEPEPIPLVAAYAIPNGFQVTIADGINYITLAGIAWYLNQQAEVALSNAMFQRAQEEERKGQLTLPRSMRRHPN